MATNDDLCWMSATELARAIRQRQLSPVEVTRAVLDRIERINPGLNAFVTVTDRTAMRSARAAEKKLMRRGASLGPLHGVPFSTKDLVTTKGIRTTFGSPLFAENIPSDDAPMVARMKAAGAIQLGKTNTPTFGWLGVTQNLLFGVTRNPWDTALTPGGSSGGAGAALAAGLGPIAIGTDGGGSIRIPSSFSGVFGIKPSFGRIPVSPPSGAWSLSHIGPMARTVEDAALALQVAAGPDLHDQYSLPHSGVDYLKNLRGSLKGWRVAWSDDLGFTKALDPEVRSICARAARRFRDFGCRVDTVKPEWSNPQRAWEGLFCGGIAARLEGALRKTRASIDPGLVKLIEKSQEWKRGHYIDSWFKRLDWNTGVQQFFEKYTLLLTPTLPCPPFPVGREHVRLINGTRLAPYEWLSFTFPFNLTGNPAVSIPCGFTKSGLPVGLQIVGRRFADEDVLRASAALESTCPWSGKRPADM